MPALRHHREDIPLIANHLLEKHCRELNKPIKRLSADLIKRFINLPWEGNVREMENVIMRGILFASSEEIRPEAIGMSEEEQAPLVSMKKFRDTPYREAKEQTLKEFNHCYIGDLLEATGGNVTHAARQCGLERQALQQIMRRYDIDPGAFRN